jgi:hypothetical protein
MYPVEFEGSVEIQKPENMTDEECMSIWAKYGFGKLKQIIDAKGYMPHVAAGIDVDGYSYYLTAWKPSYEDLQALNRGEPVYVKTLSKGLPPMALFTLDENNEGNF